MMEILECWVKGSYFGPKGYENEPHPEGEVVGLGGKVVVRLDKEDIKDMREYIPRGSKFTIYESLHEYLDDDLRNLDSRGNGFTVGRWSIVNVRRSGGRLFVEFVPDDVLV